MTEQRSVVHIDKARVARQFDRHVATYDEHATVQAMMADELFDLVASLGLTPDRILDVGSGTGIVVEHLAEQFPRAALTAIDIAPEMVRVSRAKMAGNPRVEHIVGDAETLHFGDGQFDLIVSNATIQWFEDPAATFRCLTRALAPGGAMVHTTFGPRTFEELFATYAQLDQARGRSFIAPYRGLLLRDVAEWAELVHNADAREVTVRGHLVVEHYPSVRRFLESVRSIGASNGAGEPGSAAQLVAVMRQYDERYRGPHGVSATYDVVTICARPGAQQED